MLQGRRRKISVASSVAYQIKNVANRAQVLESISILNLFQAPHWNCFSSFANCPEWIFYLLLSRGFMNIILRKLWDVWWFLRSRENDSAHIVDVSTLSRGLFALPAISSRDRWSSLTWQLAINWHEIHLREWLKARDAENNSNSCASQKCRETPRFSHHSTHSLFQAFFLGTARWIVRALIFSYDAYRYGLGLHLNINSFVTYYPNARLPDGKTIKMGETRLRKERSGKKRDWKWLTILDAEFSACIRLTFQPRSDFAAQNNRQSNLVFLAKKGSHVTKYSFYKYAYEFV